MSEHVQTCLEWIEALRNGQWTLSEMLCHLLNNEVDCLRHPPQAHYVNALCSCVSPCGPPTVSPAPFLFMFTPLLLGSYWFMLGHAKVLGLYPITTEVFAPLAVSLCTCTVHTDSDGWGKTISLMKNDSSPLKKMKQSLTNLKGLDQKRPISFVRWTETQCSYSSVGDGGEKGLCDIL